MLQQCRHSTRVHTSELCGAALRLVALLWSDIEQLVIFSMERRDGTFCLVAEFVFARDPNI